MTIQNGTGTVETTLRNVFSRPKCRRRGVKAAILVTRQASRKEIFETFYDRGEAEDYDRAMELLDAYFSPKN